MDIIPIKEEDEDRPTSPFYPPLPSPAAETAAARTTGAYANEDDDGILPLFAGEESMEYESDKYSVLLA